MKNNAKLNKSAKFTAVAVFATMFYFIGYINIPGEIDPKQGNPLLAAGLIGSLALGVLVVLGTRQSSRTAAIFCYIGIGIGTGLALTCMHMMSIGGIILLIALMAFAPVLAWSSENLYPRMRKVTS